MSEDMLDEPMKWVLRDIAHWLNDMQVPYVLIGGIAASILGRPRLTQDVDVLVKLHEPAWDEFVQTARKYGFAARIGDCAAFARQSRVMLMLHTESGIPVDIVLAGLSFEEEMISRASVCSLGGIAFPLPAPEDIIVMKSVAGRPHDIADIEGIATVQVEMDWAYISRWTGEFAVALDRSEIAGIAERIRASLPGKE